MGYFQEHEGGVKLRGEWVTQSNCITDKSHPSHTSGILNTVTLPPPLDSGRSPDHVQLRKDYMGLGAGHGWNLR